MLKFLTHRPLWVNLLAAIALSIVLFIIFILSLNFLTHHGRSRSVPQVVGKSFADAKQILDKEGFDLVIQDSVYVDTLPALNIVKQVPESDAVVKVNRTVYLTVNRSVPPKIEMPNLVGYSYRNATMTLASAGLRIGDTIYRSDFAKNAVLDQLYNGEHIAPGAKIQMGSTIGLVLGTGVGQMQFNVPNLVGWTYGDAKAKLEENGLNLLVMQAEGKDTVSEYISRQIPARVDEEGNPQRIHTGQLISVWLQIAKPVVTDSTNNLPISQ
ncbi:MAG TPA: PASTA domain-containing protein [Chitinophagaceae bacterium]